MAELYTAIKIFIATPGGLADERREFKSVIEQINQDEAYDSKLVLIPRGWEYVTAGHGRPQAKINEQIRECDYIAVIFWDKWGQPPTSTGQFTSGTEEEFYVGKECRNSIELPMKDILIFFKAIPERQLSDAGPELRKVLDFKAQLEREREFLYTTFDTTEDFSKILRNHLHTWIREWRDINLLADGSHSVNQAQTPEGVIKQGNAQHRKSEHGSYGTSSPSGRSTRREVGAAPGANVRSSDHVRPLLKRAREAERFGRTTEAEELFAQATTDSYNREALVRYSAFLRRSQRLSQAEKVAMKLVELATEAGDQRGRIEGYSNLGIIDRQMGNRDTSENRFRLALKVVDEGIDSTSPSSDEYGYLQEKKAYLLDNLSLTLRKVPGKLKEARDNLKESVDIRYDLGNEKSVAFSLRNLGVICTQLGEVDEAEETLREALGIFIKNEITSGVASTYGALANVKEISAEFVTAREFALKALDMNEAIGSSQGMSTNYSQLVRICIKLNLLADARKYAIRDLDINEESRNPEGNASARHSLGMVLLKEGEHRHAMTELTAAKEIFEQLDQPAGVAGTLINIAEINCIDNFYDRAQHNLTKARSILETSHHEGLSQELTRVEALCARAEMGEH